MKVALFAILAVCTFGFSKAQNIQKCDDKHSVWIIEKDNSFYTLKLTGKIAETGIPNVISVNDNAFQYLIVDKYAYSYEGKTASELDILITYVSTEVAYLNAQYKTKLDAQMLKAPLSADKDVLLWWYKMPNGLNDEVINQVFASIIVGDKIFGVASPQFYDQKYEDIRDFLMDAISTLKQIKDEADLKDVCN